MANGQFADLHRHASLKLNCGWPGGSLLAVLLVGLAVPLPQARAQASSVSKLLQPGKSSQPAAPPAPAVAGAAPALAPPLAIPLPQVADRADELDTMLQDISKQLNEIPPLEVEDTAVDERMDEMQDRAAQLDNLLAGLPDSVELRDEDLYWRTLNQQYTTQRKLFTNQAANLETSIQKLNEQEKIWQATADQIRDPKGIEALADRVKQELASIRSLNSRAQIQLKQVLTVQNRLSQQGKQSTEALAKLTVAEQRVRGSIFQRDSHPLWVPRGVRNSDPPLGIGIKASAGRKYASAKEFLQGAKGPFVGLVLLYLINLYLAMKLKQYASAKDWPGIKPESLEIFRRPNSLALLIPLLAVLIGPPTAPISIAFVFLILWVVMTLRLLVPIIERPFRPFLYALAVFTLIDGLRALVPYVPVLNREIFAAGSLGVLLTFVWLLLRWRRPSAEPRPTRRVVALIAIRIGLLLLAASLLANIFGYLALAHLLGVGTLFAAFYAVASYTVARVLNVLLSMLMRSELAASLPNSRRSAILRWSPHVVSFFCAVLWLRSVLYLLTVHDTVMATVSSFLALSVAFGSVRFTLGDACGVLLVLSIGYVLAHVSTFALREILLSKLHLERGLPYAIAKVTYYCLILMVFVAALAQAGVELNKFTVITGALGVGVGFGLQTIVSNFASGLILLFERPIRVEDTVEVGGLVGTVKHIGARACTVQTFQGAEVIVPNSSLLSNQVVNWTLSSPWRRVDIPVGVAYGSNPEDVIKLLVEVAESHEGVMKSPTAQAFFLGFGDSALNFELRFWADRNDTWFRLKSDVAISLARALREAGIEIPFPQRDLHLRSIDGAVKDALAAKGDARALPPGANASEDDFATAGTAERP